MKKGTKPSEVKLRSVLPKERKEPLWNLYRDGVTFSLLSRFIICRHRFWIRTVLGLRPDEGFKHPMEYGSMFHAGLEAFAESNSAFNNRVNNAHLGIKSYARKLKERFPESVQQIAFWERMAIAQFSIYANHWKQEDSKRDYIAQESVFRVATKLPSGRTIDLRGKLDELFNMKGKKKPIPTLQENKCKGEVDEVGITSSLQCDLQTMTYLHVLDGLELIDGQTCLDVLYNVMLRPLGGKYPMRQKKSETPKEFEQRAIDDMHDNPTKYFHRWRVSLTLNDLNIFRNRYLFPLLEQLCDWWDSIKDNPLDPWMTNGWEKTGASSYVPKRIRNKHHFIRPFGIYDPQLNSGRGDYHEHIISNGANRAGLKTLDTVFPELDDPSLASPKKMVEDIKARQAESDRKSGKAFRNWDE